MSVDFPDPDGPTTAVNRPLTKATDTSSNALTWAGPAPYVLLIPTARTAGGPIACWLGVLTSPGSGSLFADASVASPWESRSRLLTAIPGLVLVL